MSDALSPTSSYDTAMNLAADLRPWTDPFAEPFVSLKRVTRNFDDVYAVDDVSLDIYQGELFCLLGGSGSGKTTLLRMLAGFDHPNSGTIFIDGQNMANVRPEHRPTNMMFQSYALFPHMSVFDNVAYGLRREKVPSSEIKERVEKMLALVQLNQYGKRKPHQLSGGQRQRVALARSLVKRPKLLLLDEPLGALDKKLREETQFELVNIQEQLGVTFIVVTHDQEEAMTLSTRIGVMRDGRIEQVGTPQEIYEFPNSRFTADFIGTANIFEGHVVEDQHDRLALKCDDAGAVLHIGHGVPCTQDQKMWLAVRPEKMSISRNATDAVNQLQGKIEDIAYLGNLSIFRIELPTGKRIKVTQTNNNRHAEEDLSWGDQAYISWPNTAGVVLQT